MNEPKYYRIDDEGGSWCFHWLVRTSFVNIHEFAAEHGVYVMNQ